MGWRTPKQMSEGNWISAIYIDERATATQREDLRINASGEAGGSFSHYKALSRKSLGLKYVSITFEIASRRRRVRTPNTLEIEVEAVKGSRLDEEVRLVKDPGASQRGFTPYTVAKAVAQGLAIMVWTGTTPVRTATVLR